MDSNTGAFLKSTINTVFQTGVIEPHPCPDPTLDPILGLLTHCSWYKVSMTGDGAVLRGLSNTFVGVQLWFLLSITSHSQLPNPLIDKLASVLVPQTSVFLNASHEALLSCPKASVISHFKDCNKTRFHFILFAMRGYF